MSIPNSATYGVKTKGGQKLDQRENERKTKVEYFVIDYSKDLKVTTRLFIFHANLAIKYAYKIFQNKASRRFFKGFSIILNLCVNLFKLIIENTNLLKISSVKKWFLNANKSKLCSQKSNNTDWLTKA